MMTLQEQIEHLTRELDRRGKVIEAAQIWRQTREPQYPDSDKLHAARTLKAVIDEYTKETLRRQEAG